MWGFMVHGWTKWNRGPAAFAELLKLAHVPLPLANAWLVTLLEIFGGLALLMGAFVAIVSIPLILSMTFCLLSTAGSRLAKSARLSRRHFLSRRHARHFSEGSAATTGASASYKLTRPAAER